MKSKQILWMDKFDSVKVYDTLPRGRFIVKLSSSVSKTCLSFFQEPRRDHSNCYIIVHSFLICKSMLFKHNPSCCPIRLNFPRHLWWVVAERPKKAFWWFSGQGNPPANAGGVERCPGEGNGNPLQYSSLGNLTDRGASWATVHGAAKELDTT